MGELIKDGPTSDGPIKDGPTRDGQSLAGIWRIEPGELDRKMGVTILEQSAQRVVATMPVAGNRQSFGMLHGGASVAFAEALGSWAAVIHAGPGRSAVGLDINATHHRSVSGGTVTGVARAIRLGRRVTSHEVTLTDQDGRLLCTARITNLIVDGQPESPAQS